MSNILTLTNGSGNLLVNYKNFLPCGSIVNYAGDTAPSGWFICDGSNKNRTTYSDLFDIIGSKYGTPDSSLNFSLPDLSERIPVGKTGSTALGAIGGNNSVTLTTGQLPSHTHTGTSNLNGAHTHTATDSGHNHSYDDAYFAENLGGGANSVFGTSASTDNDNSYRYRLTPTPTTSTGYANITVASNENHNHTFTTDSTGTGQSIDIRNKFIVLNYIIKY